MNRFDVHQSRAKHAEAAPCTELACFFGQSAEQITQTFVKAGTSGVAAFTGSGSAEAIAGSTSLAVSFTTAGASTAGSIAFDAAAGDSAHDHTSLVVADQTSVLVMNRCSQAGGVTSVSLTFAKILDSTQF